jgi:hypothetical protein
MSHHQRATRLPSLSRPQDDSRTILRLLAFIRVTNLCVVLHPWLHRTKCLQPHRKCINPGVRPSCSPEQRFLLHLVFPHPSHPYVSKVMLAHLQARTLHSCCLGHAHCSMREPPPQCRTDSSVIGDEHCSDRQNDSPPLAAENGC